MTYTIKAIPTTYAGVNFRSRLEARWAAFFDLCGWKWDYEPFDLDGWAPDFLLKGKVKALVEVKPVYFSADEEAANRQARAQAAKAFRTADALYPDHQDIDGMTDEVFNAYLDARSRPPQYEILVIGNGPFKTDNWSPWCLGVMALEGWCKGEDHADLYWGGTHYLDYAARYGNYQYRIGGEYDGDGHLHQIRDDTQNNYGARPEISSNGSQITTIVVDAGGLHESSTIGT